MLTNVRQKDLAGLASASGCWRSLALRHQFYSISSCLKFSICLPILPSLLQPMIPRRFLQGDVITCKTQLRSSMNLSFNANMWVYGYAHVNNLRTCRKNIWNHGPFSLSSNFFWLPWHLSLSAFLPSSLLGWSEGPRAATLSSSLAVCLIPHAPNTAASPPSLQRAERSAASGTCCLLFLSAPAPFLRLAPSQSSGLAQMLHLLRVCF